VKSTPYAMASQMWNGIKDFTPEEFGTVDMNGILIYTLQKMRTYINRRIFVHCGFEFRDTGGYHPLKMAADIHIEDLHVVDQYLIAEKFDAFNGIGVYPFWGSPGLHLDTRPNPKTNIDSRWGCLEQGKYVKLDHEFFKRIL